jgi:hypothetical protein
MMKLLLKLNSHHFHKAELKHSNSVFFALLFSCLLITVCFVQQAKAANKIVKWKDEKGITHYGDKLPAREAGRGNSILSSQGTVIKTNESFNPKIDSKEAEKASVEQTRQDTALLASYSSAEEIDLAQARNIKSDQLSLDTLRLRLNELQIKIKTTDEKFANKKLPEYLVKDQKDNHLKIIKLQSDIAASELSIAQTVSRFKGYKARYLELRPKD